MFFDNYIGWEGIRWWRFCVCGLGFGLGCGCGVWMAGWFGFRLDWLVFWMVILVGFVGWVGLVCISDFGRERF